MTRAGGATAAGVVAIAALATSVRADPPTTDVGDRVELSGELRHVARTSGAALGVAGAMRFGDRAFLDGDAGVVWGEPGASLRNVRIGAGVATRGMGAPRLRLSVTLPTTVRQGEVAALVRTLASATPVDARALTVGLLAVTLDAGWRWALRLVTFELAAALSLHASGDAPRAPARLYVGGAMELVPHLHLGARLGTATTLLDQAEAGGEAFVHELTTVLEFDLRAWHVGATLQVPLDGSSRAVDAVAVGAALRWTRR